MKKVLFIIFMFLAVGIASAAPPTPPSSGPVNVATDTIFDAAGDLIQGSGANAGERLAVGTAYQVLHSNGTKAAWTSTLGATGTRLTHGYFIDLVVTNAIQGSITGTASNSSLLDNHAASYFQTANADLTTISNGGTASCIWGEKSDSSGIECKTSLAVSGITFTEVDGHTTGTVLTAAQLSRTQVNSYGRSGAATITLPAAASGLSGIFVIGTQHNSAWRIQRAGSDTISWISGGVITEGKTYFQETNQAVGDSVSCTSFRTGEAAYTWRCGAVTGTWVTD
jgi:hypothetical protein